MSGPPLPGRPRALRLLREALECGCSFGINRVVEAIDGGWYDPGTGDGWERLAERMADEIMVEIDERFDLEASP